MQLTHERGYVCLISVDMLTSLTIMSSISFGKDHFFSKYQSLRKQTIFHQGNKDFFFPHNIFPLTKIYDSAKTKVYHETSSELLAAFVESFQPHTASLQVNAAAG